MGFWRDMQNGEGEPTIQASSRGPVQQVVVQSAVDDAFSELQGSEKQAAEAAAEDYRALSEVETRLRKSNCYRAILDQPLFDDGASAEAFEVEAEFREFALNRLRELMGLGRQEKVEAKQFSAEEEVTLRTWAAKLMGRPAIFNVEAAAPVKTVAKAPSVQALPAPAADPVIRTMSEPVGAGRSTGRPRGVKNKFKIEVAAPAIPQPSQPAKQVPVAVPASQEKKTLEVEGTKIDGTRGLIQVDLSGPGMPAGNVQRAPMPSPQMALAMGSVAAEQRAQNNSVLQTLFKNGS